MSSDNPIDDKLWEYVYDLLPDGERAVWTARITSDPAVARAYAEICLRAARISDAVRIEGPRMSLAPPDPSQVASADDDPLRAERRSPRRSARGRSRFWGHLVVIAASILLVVLFEASRQGPDSRSAPRGAAPRDSVAVDAAAGRLLERESEREHGSIPVRTTVLAPRAFVEGASNAVTIQTRDPNGGALSTDVDVAIVDQRNQVVWSESGTTDSNGVWQVAVPMPSRRTDLSLSANTRRSAPATVPVTVRAPRFVTSIATDRAVYEPGESVQVRSVTLARPGSVEAEGVDVWFQVRRDTDARVLQESASPMATRRGVATETIPLDASAEEGPYTVIASSADGLFRDARRTFFVEKPDRGSFDVAIEFSKAVYAPGEIVVADLGIVGAPAIAGTGDDRLDGRPSADPRGPFESVDRLRSERELTDRRDADGEPVSFSFRAGVADLSLASGQLSSGPARAAQLRFALPESVPDGPAFLEVIAAKGSEDRRKVASISIDRPRVELRYFPEGGALHADLLNRVYFEAVDAAHMPVSVKGRLVDASGQDVVLFATEPGERTGRGRFAFVPEVGVRYRTRLDDPTGLVTDAGLSAESFEFAVTMRAVAEVYDGRNPLQFDIQANRDRKPLAAVAACGDMEVGQIAFESSRNPVSRIAIPVGGDASGVVRVTLFDLGVQPPRALAERLVYRRPERGLLIGRSDDGPIVEGKNVTLGLRVLHESGAASDAIVGAVVRRAHRTPGDEVRSSFPADIWLLSEIEEPAAWEDASLYVQDGPDASRSMDLLLGTRGWRRIDPSSGPDADPSERLSRRTRAMFRRNESAERNALAFTGASIGASSALVEPPLVADNLGESLGPSAESAPAAAPASRFEGRPDSDGPIERATERSSSESDVPSRGAAQRPGFDRRATGLVIVAVLFIILTAMLAARGRVNRFVLIPVTCVILVLLARSRPVAEWAAGRFDPSGFLPQAAHRELANSESAKIVPRGELESETPTVPRNEPELDKPSGPEAMADAMGDAKEGPDEGRQAMNALGGGGGGKGASGAGKGLGGPGEIRSQRPAQDVSPGSPEAGSIGKPAGAAGPTPPAPGGLPPPAPAAPRSVAPERGEPDPTERRTGEDAAMPLVGTRDGALVKSLAMRRSYSDRFRPADASAGGIPSTIAWHPLLETNAAGETAFTFEMPTAPEGEPRAMWDLYAAAHGAGRLGEFQTPLATRRSVEMAVQMPARVVVGDTFIARLHLTNLTAFELRTPVRIDPQSLVEVDPEVLEAVVEPGKSATFDVHVRAPRAGREHLVWRTSVENAPSNAAQPFEVGPAGYWVEQSIAGELGERIVDSPEPVNGTPIGELVTSWIPLETDREGMVIRFEAFPSLASELRAAALAIGAHDHPSRRTPLAARRIRAWLDDHAVADPPLKKALKELEAAREAAPSGSRALVRWEDAWYAAESSMGRRGAGAETEPAVSIERPGAWPDGSAEPIDVALASRVAQLERAPEAPSMARRLEAFQREDGRVSRSDEPSDEENIARAFDSTALAALVWSHPDFEKPFGEPRRAALAWIRSRRRGDGGFGSPDATALAALALVEDTGRPPIPEGDEVISLHGLRADTPSEWPILAGDPRSVVWNGLGSNERMPVGLIARSAPPMPYLLHVRRWVAAMPAAPSVPLAIETQWSATEVRIGESLRMRAKVTSRVSGSLTVRIGIPAGLSPDLRDVPPTCRSVPEGLVVALTAPFTAPRDWVRSEDVMEFEIPMIATFQGTFGSAPSSLHADRMPTVRAWSPAKSVVVGE